MNAMSQPIVGEHCWDASMTPQRASECCQRCANWHIGAAMNKAKCDDTVIVNVDIAKSYLAEAIGWASR